MHELTRVTGRACPAWCAGEHDPGDPHLSALETFGVRVGSESHAVHLLCAWLASEPSPYVELYLHDGTSIEMSPTESAFWGRVLAHISPGTLDEFAEALAKAGERLGAGS